MIRRILAGLALLTLLGGCFEETAEAPPPPVAMTDTAVGHYCGMFLYEHDGPKAQIHIAGREEPLWFSQVRDAIAFTRLPEETDTVTAIYVNDMSRAASWQDAGHAPWIEAGKAAYVIGSRRHGGMGAPEAVPFGDGARADAFAAENGGQVVGFADIPDDYVLAPVDVAPQPLHEGHAPGSGEVGMSHEDGQSAHETRAAQVGVRGPTDHESYATRGHDENEGSEASAHGARIR